MVRYPVCSGSLCNDTHVYSSPLNQSYRLTKERSFLCEWAKVDSGNWFCLAFQRVVHSIWNRHRICATSHIVRDCRTWAARSVEVSIASPLHALRARAAAYHSQCYLRWFYACLRRSCFHTCRRSVKYLAFTDSDVSDLFCAFYRFIRSHACPTS